MRGKKVQGRQQRVWFLTPSGLVCVRLPYIVCLVGESGPCYLQITTVKHEYVMLFKQNKEEGRVRGVSATVFSLNHSHMYLPNLLVFSSSCFFNKN